MIRNFIFCFVLLLSASSFAQFSINLTPTPETCYGNGAISVTVDNTVAGATVDYVLYKLPNVTTPLASGVGDSGQTGYPFTFSGLTTGDYEVVATQSLGAPVGSVVGQETVLQPIPLVSPLTTETDKWILCGEDGWISAEILQGTAQYYILRMEQPAGSGIFVDVAGPQDGGESSTLFENLTPGHYRVVIRDAVCDNDVVITEIIDPVTIGPADIGVPRLTPIFGDDCDASSVFVELPIQVPLIAFPIEVTITVYPPDYPATPVDVIGPLTIDAQGPVDPQQLMIETLIPYYQGQYYFMVHITNQCGDTWSNFSGNIPVAFELDVNARLSEKLCYGIDVLAGYATGGNITIQFLDRDDYLDGIETILNVGHISDFPLNTVDAIVQSPAGELHPGPFPTNPQGGSATVTYGIYDMYWLDAAGDPIYVDNDGNIVTDPDDGEMVPVLVGDYVIKVIDGCGIVGYIDGFSVSAEISEPNLVLNPMPPLPSPTPDYPDYDPFLDCIDVGGIYINHVLYFDWAEDQDGNWISPNIGKIEIIDGPDDYLYFLANYTNSNTDPDDPTVIPYTLPLDVTWAVGTPAAIDPNPPFPNEVTYSITPSVGGPRPLFPGLVGAGWYTIRITDICGNVWEIEEELKPFFESENTFSIDVAEGCGEYGSVNIIPNFDESVGYPVYMKMIEAPAQFSTDFAFMDDGSGVIDLVNAVMNPANPTGPLGYWFFVPAVVPGDPGSWHFRIGNLPAGHYEFDTKIGCAETIIEFDIFGYEQELTAFQKTDYCGNFSFMFDYTSNSSENWVAMYAVERCTLENIEDCTEADWVEVMSGLSPAIMNNGVTAINGHYRIVKYYQAFSNDILSGTGPQIPFCKVVLHEFEYYALPGIQSIDVLSCPDGESITIVNATGAQPLTYELVTVSINGGVVTVTGVVIDNGESNVFEGLEPGEYYFRITDNCEATVVGAATVGQPVALEVIEDNNCDGTEDALCHGNYGCLSVDYISVFEYTWYKLVKDADGNVISETEILDTDINPSPSGNRLNFSPYDTSVHSGWYRVYFNAIDSDLDFCDVNYIDYLLIDESPNAGDDVSETYCHTNQSIDLSTLLTAGTTSGGTWVDVDNTGALSGSVFDTTGIAFGTYTFRYEVGGCNGYDESLITIILAEEPGIPAVDAFDAVCPGDDLTLSIAGANPQFTYHWTLPNGNTYTGATVPLTDVTDQDAGTYSVYASLGNCESDPITVTVTVKPLAQFTINTQQEICTTLTVVGSNFNAAEVTYVWTLGGAVVGTDVSLVADEAGIYSVEVTLDGCTSSQTITVEVPTVVIDYGCIDNQFMVFVANTGDFPNATYEWTGPGFSGNGNSVNLSGLETGDYMVTVTDSEGCSVSAPVTVTGTQCVIPKGVSPNGDGKNDTFDLSNFNVNEVKIFNRYGKTVYEKDNGYTNDWYGQTTDSDKLLPSGTYYYLVTFIDGEQKSGWVYLNKDE